MPMNQMNMISMNQMNNSQTQNMMNKGQNKSETINVFFRIKDGEGKPPIMIPCSPDDKINEIIEKYRKASSDNDQNKKFLFNGKPFNQTLSAAEAGLSDQSNIFVAKEEEKKEEEKKES